MRGVDGFRSEAATMTLRGVSSTRTSTASTTEECWRQTFAEACSSWHTHTHHGPCRPCLLHPIALCWCLSHFVTFCHYNCDSFNSNLNQSARPSASCLRATFASSSTPTLAWSSGGHQVAIRWPWLAFCIL